MHINLGKQTGFAALIAPVGLAVGLALGTSAVNAANYAKSAGGPIVKNPYGQCWQMSGGTPDCGDKAPEPGPVDSDGDGVTDNFDKCPGTPKGVRVDSSGCPLDTDGDGVPDYRDNCPGTPTGAKVDSNGCEIVKDVTVSESVGLELFDFDSANLKPGMTNELDKLASAILASKGEESLTIIGHTDSVGPAAYNQNLSERRANAVADYLASKGVSRSNMTISGQGESNPVADNSTASGRAQNRRVEIRTR